MKRNLKLAPEYGCFPLWKSTGYEPVSINIDPKSLPISSELACRIEAWDSEYQCTLKQDYPPDSHFESIEAYEQYINEGKHILEKLLIELGDEYLIEYLPTSTAGPNLK